MASSLASLVAFVVLKSQIDTLQAPGTATSSTRSDRNASDERSAMAQKPFEKPLWKAWLDGWRNRNATSQNSDTIANATADANNASGEKTSAPMRVWVDVESLARRHPAWKLATQLASQTSLKNTLAPVAPPQSRAFSKSDTALNTVSRQNDSLYNGAGERVLDVSSLLRARPVMAFDARGELASIRAARTSQGVFIDNLSRDLSGNLARERAVRERESRAILEEEIAAALASDFSSISPILLSEAEQLELTNLRLKLLPSSILSDEEKRMARERLTILQSRWDKVLRRQESQNLANIEELREVEPRRLRVQGEAAILLSQNRLQTADATRLRNLRESQNALLARDFNSLQALRPLFAPVAINVAAAPASPLPSLNSRVMTSGNRSATSRSATARSSTIVVPTQSTQRVLDVALIDIARHDSVFAANKIANLRAQARREAASWTRIVAQRNGWQVVNASSLDGTLADATLRNVTEDVWRVWKQ